MPQPKYLTTPQNRRIAYHQSDGSSPGIIFLGGYRSDMTGTKAMALEDWARKQGRAFLRFDYAGHGQSGGDFNTSGIGDWFADAQAALSLTHGRQILVGSSMGGWIALLLARRFPDRVAGLVGIAAAPDFTEDGLLPSLNNAEKADLSSKGWIERPSAYAAEPYVFTNTLLDQGRQNLVLRSPLTLTFPTRFLQGSADDEVSPSTALRLFNHAQGPDIRLTLVQGADHRFSTPQCLALIVQSVADIVA